MRGMCAPSSDAYRCIGAGSRPSLPTLGVARARQCSRIFREAIAHLDSRSGARSFVLAAYRVVAGLPDPLEIPRVRATDTHRVVNRLQRRCAKTELSTATLPPSLLGRGKCSCVGIQSLNSAVTGSK